MVIFSLFLGVLARAGDVRWTLSGGGFSDGGTLTGSFVFNADTGQVRSWNFSVNGGDLGNFPPFVFDPGSSSQFGAPGAFTFQGPLFPAISPFPNANRQLRIGPFDAALTNAGGSVATVASPSGNAECYNCAPFRVLDATFVGTPLPDLTIVKTHVGNFFAGQNGAVYNIQVSNTGLAPTTGIVTVVDTLPSGFSATAISGTGWSCSLPTLTCTRSDALAVSGSYPPINLTVNIVTDAPPLVSNTATVSGGGEFDTTNDTASDQTTVGYPDLTITKSHAGNFRQGQVGATYTISVLNVGGGPTFTTASVVDSLPAGLTATGLNGAGWSCTLGTLTCTRADALAPASAYPPITLTVNVASNAPASVVNNVSVSVGGDQNGANNASADPTTIVAVADLTIAKTHAGSFTQGQTGALYTITVSNAGPGPTLGTVSVIDTLPASLTATGISGTGWSCTLATLTCTRTDVLPISSSYPTITVTVNVASNAPASVINSAAVSGGGELNTANNTAADSTAITFVPDLTLTKTHTGTLTQGQTGVNYTIIVSNGGPGSTLSAVTVIDTLPTGLSATALAGTGWSCTLATFTCTRSDALAPNASYPPITLTANVAANAPANLVNIATVSGGGELVTTNDSASDPAAVILVPDLTITKTHSGTFIQSQTGTYTIGVGNAGPGSTLSTVTVTDSLPGSLTATSLSGPGWTCVLATLTCTRSDVLAPNASYPPITLGVTISGTAPATVTNIATVSGGGQLNTANDTSSDLTLITQLTSINVSTSPLPLSFDVDGVSYSAPQTFRWIPGSSHVIGTTTPQIANGLPYVFRNWSDSGAIRHGVTTPSTATIYSAQFGFPPIVINTTTLTATAGSRVFRARSVRAEEYRRSHIPYRDLPG